MCYRFAVEYIEPFSDVRHDLTCAQCGAPKDGRPFTRDHLPTKSLLDRPLPDDVPTLDICAPCNNVISRDEEYLKVLLSCVFEGTCEPGDLQDEKVSRALARNAPLREELRQARKAYDTFGGNERVIWQPNLERLLPPLIKNAKGHFAYELAERLSSDPAKAAAALLQNFDEETRAAFETVSIGSAWPEVGSRMMDRLISGRDLAGGWIVVQPDVYRYAIHEYSAVRIVIREYLAFEAIWDCPSVPDAVPARGQTY